MPASTTPLVWRCCLRIPAFRGGCARGLENLQMLCAPCHADITKEHAKKCAAERCQVPRCAKSQCLMRCTARNLCIWPRLAKKTVLLLGRALHKQTTLDGLVTVISLPAARQDAPLVSAEQPAIRRGAAKKKRLQTGTAFPRFHRQKTALNQAENASVVNGIVFPKPPPL